MSAATFTPTRRSIVAAACAIATAPTMLLARERARLIAGTYAREGGAGLVPLATGPDGWTAGQAHTAINNASFGARVNESGVRYLLDEQEQGSFSVYDRDLRRLATHATLGADPCHVALSPDGRMLAVANYSSGSIALWRLDQTTGVPVGEGQLIAHKGSGPNRERQAGPHAHWVGFHARGRLVHAVDLGADAIFAHSVDPATGRIVKSSIAYLAPAGSGPRHLTRHPRLPIAYLVAELANTVTTLDARRDGSFSARATLSTLPVGHDGVSAAAHIALNRTGTRLYVSNRGHDSIAVFAIDSRGTLRLIEHVGCGGRWPRMFLLLEDRDEMLIANERSGNVARLALGADGRLGNATQGPSVAGVAFLQPA